jgi:LAO/AO transport system kinase
LIDAGRRVAVLAIDPSSRRSGGSILGDKTRMPDLARSGSAFIRPSPSGGTVGGIARRTRDDMLLCEAFGFDVVVIETVGVGQSETAVDELVDVFILLVQPGSGDELQGIKRGIVELADVVVVSKADGELEAAARRAAAEYSQALRLLRPKVAAWRPPVVPVSARTGNGVATIWNVVTDHRRVLQREGILATRRAEQARAWLWSEITAALVEDLERDPPVSEELRELEQDVVEQRISPGSAARAVLRRRRDGDGGDPSLSAG